MIFPSWVWLWSAKTCLISPSPIQTGEFPYPWPVSVCVTCWIMLRSILQSLGLVRGHCVYRFWTVPSIYVFVTYVYLELRCQISHIDIRCWESCLPVWVAPWSSRNLFTYILVDGHTTLNSEFSYNNDGFSNFYSEISASTLLSLLAGLRIRSRPGFHRRGVDG